MGLDQYAYTKDKEGEQNEIAYWRKHPNLQGWMEQLWISKGGDSAESFNCIELELTEADLVRLQSEILSESVASLGTRGFFFGDTSDEWYREQDLKFIEEALALVREGNPVYYNSWW